MSSSPLRTVLMASVLVSSIVCWSSQTHSIITNAAIQLSRTTVFLSNRESIIIENGSVIPDITEHDGHLYIGHFFDPMTFRNPLGMQNPTALTRFESHLEKASRSADNLEALESLGKALHYFQDVHVPYHVADMYELSKHMKFEDRAEIFASTLLSGVQYTDPNDLDLSMDPRNLFMNAARYSKKVYDDVQVLGEEPEEHVALFLHPCIIGSASLITEFLLNRSDHGSNIFISSFP